MTLRLVEIIAGAVALIGIGAFLVYKLILRSTWAIQLPKEKIDELIRKAPPAATPEPDRPEGQRALPGHPPHQESPPQSTPPPDLGSMDWMHPAGFDYKWKRTQGTGTSKCSGPTPPDAFIERLVFYATDRGRAPKPVHYGTDISESLNFGTCLVTVPTKRDIGTVPVPTVWTLWHKNPAKHYLLQEVDECPRSEFISRLRTYLAASTSKTALVFVHGFNVIFSDAVLRTAQIAADLNFSGAPILYSWPSEGSRSLSGYTHDLTHAAQTLPHLKEFLRLIVDRTGAETIFLLAHSMGNFALTSALRDLEVESRALAVPQFHELILTAPDIDAKVFVDQIAPAITRVAQRVTLYASSNDKALAFSKSINGGPRAGDSGASILVLDGIDSIDVTAVDTDFVGHSYYGDNSSVLSDIFYLLDGQPVRGRFGMRPERKGARDYFVFLPVRR